MAHLQQQWFNILAGGVGRYRLYGKSYEYGKKIESITSPFKFFARYKGLLPREYQEVEYIGGEKNSQQYIDSGFAPNQDTSVEIVFSYSDPHETHITFEIISTDEPTRYFDIRIGSLRSIAGSPFAVFEYKYGNTFGEMDIRCQTGYDEKFTLKAEKNKLYDGNDETSPTILPEQTFQSNSTIKIGQPEEPLEEYTRLPWKCYGVKIWDDETLIRNLIPCYRKSDKKAGLYDTVNNEFYVNQGTGADFNVGKEVNLVKTYTPESDFILTKARDSKDTFETNEGIVNRKNNLIYGPLIANHAIRDVDNGLFSIEKRLSEKPFVDMKNITDTTTTPNIILTNFKSVPYWYMQHQPINYSVSVYNKKIYIYISSAPTITQLHRRLQTEKYLYELAIPITEQKDKIMLPKGIDYILDANGDEVPFEELTDLNNFSNKKFEGKNSPTITAEKVITAGFTSSNGEHFTQLYIYEDGEIWYVNNQGSAQAFASDVWETEYKQIQFDSGVRLTTEERNALLNAYDLI